MPDGSYQEKSVSRILRLESMRARCFLEDMQKCCKTMYGMVKFKIKVKKYIP